MIKKIIFIIILYSIMYYLNEIDLLYWSSLIAFVSMFTLVGLYISNYIIDDLNTNDRINKLIDINKTLIILFSVLSVILFTLKEIIFIGGN